MLGNVTLANKVNFLGPENGDWHTHTPEILCFQCEHNPKGIPTWNQTSIRQAVLPIIYTLHFHTEDATIEVTENHEDNSGLGSFTKLLSRSRLPKQWQHMLGNDYRRGCGEGLENDGAENYYSAKDLVVGESVTVYGRVMKLVACDEHTKNWYEKTMGIIQPAGKVWERPLTAKIVHPIPKSTGFGDEEDSLGSVLHLVPKRPKGKDR